MPRRVNKSDSSKFQIKPLTKKQLLTAIVSDVKPIRWWLALGAIISLLGVVCGVFAPSLLGEATNIVSEFVDGNPFDTVKFNNILILLVSLYAGNAVLSVCRTLLMNRVVSRFFTCALRIKMSDKIRRMSVGYIDSTDKGELIERMTDDVSTIGNTVHEVIDLAVSGFFQLALIIVFMVLESWSLALIVIALIPLSFLSMFIIAGRSSKLFDSMMQSSGELYSVIDETYNGEKTVRAYKMEEFMTERHHALNSSIADSSKRAYFISAIMVPVQDVLMRIVYIAVCLVGGYLAINSMGVSIGAVVAIVLYSSRIVAPLDSFASALGTFQRTSSAARRVYGMIALDEELPDPVSCEFAGDSVQIENVTFGYTPEKAVIKNFNLDVKKGQKIAFVGPTGGGKTTIVNLLMRFYDPQEGKIFIDGKDISTVNRVDVRNAFGMVLQDTWLYSGSVADNVRYGAKNAPIEDVISACKSAYCDEFIRTLPNGYDTLINEDASNISQGQKQLLTIARALLANRPMIILDEATSNVDTRTELLLQSAMDKLMEGRTCFVIAHRLSTIINADKIVVINNGEIMEMGSHAELMAREGFYHEMFLSQYSIV